MSAARKALCCQLEVFGLHAVPSVKTAFHGFFRIDLVDTDSVHSKIVLADPSEAPSRFLKDDPLGSRHDPHAGHFPVAEDLLQGIEPLDERVKFGKDQIPRLRDSGPAGDQPAQDTGEAPHHGQQAVGEHGKLLRITQEGERLPCRGTVHDQDVVEAFLVHLQNTDQGTELLKAGKQEDFIRLDPSVGLLGNELPQIFLESSPGASAFHGGIDLHGIQAGEDLPCFRIKLRAQRIAQAVRLVRTHDQNLFSFLRDPHSGRGGDARLTDPAFSRIDQDPHPSPSIPSLMNALVAA